MIRRWPIPDLQERESFRFRTIAFSRRERKALIPVTNTQEIPPLVRKAAPDAVALAAVTVAGLIALNVWWTTIAPALLLYSLPPLAVMVPVLLHNLRYRVIVDESGIRGRGLTGEKSIPWREVTGVRAAAGTEGSVVVGRHSGPPLVLRELPVGAGGTGDLVAELRRRAGAPAEEPSGAWYVGRPSRRPLVWVFPMLAGSVALALASLYGALKGFGSGTAFSAGVAGAVYHLRLVLLSLYGHTVAGPSGLDNRSALGVKHLDWDRIRRLEIVRSPFGHRVLVVPEMGPKFALAPPHRPGGPRTRVRRGAERAAGGGSQGPRAQAESAVAAVVSRVRRPGGPGAAGPGKSHQGALVADPP